MILIQQGAEAKVYKSTRDGIDIIIKQRVKKAYRIPELDEKITRKRNAKEYKILLKLQNLGFVPNLLSKTSDSITMEYISDVSLRDLLQDLKATELNEISQKISILISKLHNLNVIHGDLTCSNILFRESFFLIDFGLSTISPSIEDKAVDLYVLKKSLDALNSEISEEESLFSLIPSFLMFFVNIIQNLLF